METTRGRSPVYVLLSTYNGEKFIAQQLDSLLSQTYINTHILIRDDGSNDSTVKIIQKYTAIHSNISFTAGTNIGVVSSFLSLLSATPGSEENLYAFCDQDDVWIPEKIERAVTQLVNQTTPEKTLYCSKQQYVDDNLRPIGESPTPKAIGFHNAIVENIAVGCTVVFGSYIREKMLQASSRDMIMHDWWAYLIASSFGHVIYDARPSIKYRQHSSTVTGFEPGLRKLKNRFFNFFHRWQLQQHEGLDSLNQAVKFAVQYPELPPEHKHKLDQLISLRQTKNFAQRLDYLLKTDIRRTNLMETLALKAMILFRLH